MRFDHLTSALGPYFIASLVLSASARANDLVRGGSTFTVPEGSNSAAVDLVNKVTTLNGAGLPVGTNIVDLDVTILTATTARKIAGGHVAGVTETSDDSSVDDNNNEQWDAGEESGPDSDTQPPHRRMRLQMNTVGGSDGTIEPQHVFRLHIQLDGPADAGGVVVQVTPTDAQGDAMVACSALGPCVAEIIVPRGSDDAWLVCSVASPTSTLTVECPTGVTIDPSRTSSAAFPIVNITGRVAAFSGASIPSGGAVDARIQFVEPADAQPYSLRAYANTGITLFNYCTAGSTTSGCQATMSGSGAPSASASSGFVLGASNVEGQKIGLFFYGIDNAGFSPVSWGSTSFLCVKAPTQRLPSQNSGGTANTCGGTLSIDFLAFLASHPGALGQPFAAGVKVYAQAWFRDPPASKTTNLSDALEFSLCP